MAFLQQAHRAEIAFADGCPSPITEFLSVPDAFFIIGCRFIISP
jgi:hypothetical protein